MATLHHYFVPVTSRPEIMYLGEDRISSMLRNRPTLADGFVKIETHGVRRVSAVFRVSQLSAMLLSAAFRSAQILSIITRTGEQKTGLVAWRYALRKSGMQGSDSELDVILLY